MMARFRFRMRTMMIAIAAAALLMGLVRFALQDPMILGISGGVLFWFGTSGAILITPFVVHRLDKAHVRVSPQSPPRTHARSPAGEAEKV
jgi:hypothetical protein